MVTLSLNDPEIVAAARMLAGEPHFRHLNLGALVTDSDLRDMSPVLDELARTAWATGNPGFLFIDRIQKDHRLPGAVRACNPCGEQFLANEEGCNLASLNLAAFVDRSAFDWDAFRQVAATAVRFLDDAVDASAFPSAESKAMAVRRRRIGLGVLGFASALHRLGLRYGSPESVNIAQALAKTLRPPLENCGSGRGPFVRFNPAGWILLLRLWACGQRACVVQAKRHVHSPIAQRVVAWWAMRKR